MASQKNELKLKGRSVTVSNPDKVMFPATGFTKADVIEYYIRVSQFILPHLKNRPLTMIRFPNGIDADHFFEKDAPRHTPDWVHTYNVPRKNGKGKINYVMINDLPSLVWTANLACLEMHVLLGCAPKIQQPASIVFDLDPGEPAGILNCAQTAVWLTEVLERLELKSFAKVSGSKGIQLYVPLNTSVDYETTGSFSHAIAEKLESLKPDEVVSSMSKELRGGKVFIDWSQNSYFKTTVCVYSLRAKRENPYVSMPIRNSELKTAMESQDPDSLFFTPEDAVKRLEKMGDLFEPVLNMKQKIPANYAATLEKIQSLRSAVVGEKKSTGKTKVAALTSSRKSSERESRRESSDRKAAPGPKTGIDVYNKKRNFKQTAEPRGSIKAGNGKDGRLFVIQKHQASRLHYDFRLEMEGVLRSWAVPKGLPASKTDKRLAMHVEDHPMDYARFEGIIPQGNYGAGTVMVWDIGSYEVEESSPEQAYYSGKIPLVLKGKKLRGKWTLVRMGKKDRYGKEPWLLMKRAPEMHPISARREDQSALTGRSMKKIANDRDSDWTSNKTRSR